VAPVPGAFFFYALYRLVIALALLELVFISPNTLARVSLRELLASAPPSVDL
jgi:hypothetical protein